MMVTAQKTQPATNQTRPASGRRATPNSRAGAGNRHRAEPLQPSGILQAKLTIGQANDSFEQEADRVADQVMGMPGADHIGGLDHTSATNSVQRSCGCSTKNESSGKCTKCRKQQLSMKRREGISQEAAHIP